MRALIATSLILAFIDGSLSQTTQVLELDGTTRLELPVAGPLGASPEKTIEAWIFLGTPSVPTPRQSSQIYAEGSITGWPLFQCALESTGAITLAVHRGGWHEYHSAPSNIAHQEWHHVVVRVGNDQLGMFFLDGQPLTAIRQDTIPVPASDRTYTSSLFSSGTCTGATHTPDFIGRSAQVRLWTRALSPSEIQTAYTMGAVASHGLLAHYPLDGRLDDLQRVHTAQACGPVTFVQDTIPGGATPGPVTSLTVNADPVLGLQLQVSDPGNPGGTVLLWMCDYLQPTWVGPYLSQLPLFPSAAYANGTGLITIADDFSLFGPAVSPSASLDASGEWALSFPTALLHYIYGFPAQDIHFEATTIDWSSPAAPDAVTVLPVQTFRKPQFP